MFRIFIVFLGFLLLLQGCNDKPKEKKAGIVVLTNFKHCRAKELNLVKEYQEESKVKIEGKNGKFEFKVETEHASEFTLSDENKTFCKTFWVSCEADTIKLSCDASEVNAYLQVEGCKMEDDSKRFDKEYILFSAPLGENSYKALLMNQYAMHDASKEEKEQMEEKLREAKAKDDDFLEEFIKTNPGNIYAAQLLYNRLTTKTGGESARYLSRFSRYLKGNHPYGQMVLHTIGSMLQVETDVKDFVKNAADVSYKVDKSFTGDRYKNITYLTIFNDDYLCALSGTGGIHSSSMPGQKKEEANFLIQIITTNGMEIRRFKIEDKGVPSAVAVDDSKNIYVFLTQKKFKEVKFRGMVAKQELNDGVVCIVYNSEGVKQKEMKMKGRKVATGARINGDHLFVSDNNTSSIGIYDKNTGELKSSIEGMRPCCSILDLDVTKDNQILVANLGSFRVDAYNMKGEKLVSFGQRGKGIDDFSGCCNPVSLRKLDNGCIVTVEKTPTRIKVYSKNGAAKIDGIDELVDGCFHIPVTSDRKNNIFLASPEKGLVKCVVK